MKQIDYQDTNHGFKNNIVNYYPGDDIVLYSRFDNTESTSFLTIPTVEIYYNNECILNTQMQTVDYIDYYYTYTLPMDAKYGQYEVVYNGFYNNNINKIFETFYVLNYQSTVNPIRLYGKINDYRTHDYIENVEVEIINTVDNIKYICYANLIGEWECYVYAGNYKFIFKKPGYKTQEVIAKISNDLQQQEFNNVLLEKITNDILGNGLFEIKEQYLLKDGQPIENLDVLIYNTKDLVNAIVKTKTNDDGYWYAYLDEGNYLLKLNGKFNGSEYNKTFRLRVFNNGTFNLQDISTNYATKNTVFISNGNGPIDYIDYVLDKNQNPIIDVQVNILKSNKDILYQCYTDQDGKFIFHLEKGNYDIEYYHPSFKTITSKIEVV